MISLTSVLDRGLFFCLALPDCETEGHGGCGYAHKSGICKRRGAGDDERLSLH